MSIWSIQVYKFAIWSCPSRRYDPKETNNILKDLLDVSGTADVGYDDDGKDHDITVCVILQICGKENLKLNKDKCHFRCTSAPSLGKLFPDIEFSQTHENSLCLQKCLHQSLKSYNHF